MRVQNELAAKILSEVIAEGMRMSDIDLSERVKCEATTALDEIKLAMYKTGESEKAKLDSIKAIMKKYNIGDM